MKKLIYSQIRQLGFNKLKFVVWLLMALLSAALGPLLTSGESGDVMGLSASSMLLDPVTFRMIFSMCFLFIGLAAGNICVDDFQDKTINYEVLSGTSRSRIYFARMIVAVLFSLLGSLLLLAIPVAEMTWLYGWGDYFTPAEFLPRALVLVPILLRGICLIAAVSFIVKNPYVTMMLGFFGFTFSMTAEGMFPHAPAAMCCGTSFAAVMRFDMWERFTMDGTAHMAADPALAAGTLWQIALWSLAAAAVYLAVGCMYFRQDDLN